MLTGCLAAPGTPLPHALQLRGQADAARKFELRLSEELARTATLMHGAGLEAASAEELEAVGRLHDQGLRRANSLLAKRGRPGLGDFARAASPALGMQTTPANSATASPVAAKPSFRSSLGHPQHQQHPQQLRPPQSPQLGGMASAGLHHPALSASVSGPQLSLDSLGSLGASASLFGGANWGMHSMGQPLQQQQQDAGAAAAHRRSQSEAAGRAMDAANMERLLGLLPSDLLHS